MKIFKLITLLVIVLLSLNSCVKSRVATYPGFNYPPSNPNNIQVYYLTPPVEFEIIGEVEARGAPAASWGRVEGYLKRKAASIGGDAVVLISSREQYSGTYRTPSSGNVFVHGNYIYYTYNPSSSYAVKRKHVIGLVLKWKN